MKNTLYFLTCLVLFFSACASESTSDTSIKKKGDEASLVQRYMKDLIANPTTQADVDRNLIVNMLMDSLWDFQKTASGIYYQIETPGIGGHPDLNSDLQCHYRGTLMDGREFDSSYGKGQPLKFRLGQVVAGWQEAIPLLQKGGKGTFIIPSRLAYGQRPRGRLIKPNSVLVFDIELVDFQ